MKYVEVKKIKTQNIVIIMIVASLIVLLFTLLFHPIPATNIQVINNVIFYLGGLVSGITIFLFGGRKTDEEKKEPI